ncbi:MAG: anaerobic ribonucleoside-triphosphate reductase activating protein [Euryarchaeota archaeon]|nr:anaerobic ribonucleoside-triphosphate reductase activating protein [Euryarchaeota archaeon]
MIVGGTAISSLDFPNKISLTIFTGGCILRCPYCHNPEIIEGGEPVKVDEIKKEIIDSLEFIDSIVITGGEPLIQYKDVEKILKFSKEHNLKTKIDTNGCFPRKLQEIIELVDYVGLDIKAPFHKYKEIIGSDVGDKVKKSLMICLNFPETYLECKTTYVPALMDKSAIIEIAREIECDMYTIQQFRNRIVLDKKLQGTPVPTREELRKIAKEINPFLKNVKIKTYEFGEEIID